MIVSKHNPQIKAIDSLLLKSKTRRDKDLFVLEGLRETRMALQAGYVLQSLYYCPAILYDPLQALALPPHGIKPIPIEESLYRRWAYRGSTEGILAIAKTRITRLEQIKLPERAFVIVLESVEKPGNLGAILRTADAIRATAVIVCDPLTDLYNPNLIRSSVGCIFTVPTAVCTSLQAFEWLRKNGIAIYAAALQDSREYHHVDFRPPSAIVMGTESEGLSTFWREKAASRIKIPMLGAIDSLNVSVSTAVLCFEAMRQRNFE